MSPVSKSQLARDHLNRGLENLWGDPAEAALWLFLAAEAAVTALAEASKLR